MQREIPSHDGCFTKEPNFPIIFSHVKVTHEEIVWWECQLPHLDLMQVGDALRWHHMRDFDTPPQVHILVCIYVVLLPCLDDIVLFFMGLYG